MRDGVKLRADFSFLRVNGTDSRSWFIEPYEKHNAEKDYETFVHAAERGYTLSLASKTCVGRYASEGDSLPTSKKDTMATTPSSGQRRSPGRMDRSAPLGSPTGSGSVAGCDQNPPHLKAMVPAMTFSTPQNFFFAWGTWDMSVDRLDLEQHCARHSGKKEFARSKTSQEAARRLQKTSPRLPTANCPRRPQRIAGCCTLLLRMASAST